MNAERRTERIRCQIGKNLEICSLSLSNYQSICLSLFFSFVTGMSRREGQRARDVIKLSGAA